MFLQVLLFNIRYSIEHCPHTNGSKHCSLAQIILFNITFLFAHSSKYIYVSQIIQLNITHLFTHT